MPSAADYDVTVIGDESKLRELKGSLLTAIEECPGGGAGWGRFNLLINRLFPDVDGEREHTWIAINDERVSGEPIIGPMVHSAETGMHRLFFQGTSKWTLPFGLVSRLSKRFPDLEFRFGGTIEHELSEDWIAKDGDVTRTSLIFQLIQNQLVVFFVRDGKLLDVPEFEDNSYECDYGNTEGPTPIIPDDLIQFCSTFYLEHLGCECPGVENGQLRESVLTLLHARARRFETQPAIDWDEEPGEQVGQMSEDIVARGKSPGAESPVIDGQNPNIPDPFPNHDVAAGDEIGGADEFAQSLLDGLGSDSPDPKQKDNQEQ